MLSRGNFNKDEMRLGGTNGKKAGHQSVSCREGISPAAKICSLSAWQTSLPISERQMRTPAPTVRCSMRLGGTKGKKTGHRVVRCRGGISSGMNIPTPYALKASFQIFGWGMRTPAPSVRCSMRLGGTKGKKKDTRLGVFFLW